MTEDYKKAYEDLNQKYVQKCAEFQMKEFEFKKTFTDLKNDLKESLKIIKQNQAFWECRNLIPNIWDDEVPEWLQDLMTYPSMNPDLFWEKWGFSEDESNQIQSEKSDRISKVLSEKENQIENL